MTINMISEFRDLGTALAPKSYTLKTKSSHQRSPKDIPNKRKTVKQVRMEEVVGNAGGGR